MSDFGFSVRDTFLTDGNLDDFYSNGNQYNGPVLFGVDWIEADDCPHVNANKRYSVNNYESVAYDKYRIQMPTRYQDSGRNDAIIHEIVHFLQKNTAADEQNYIRFNGSNYSEYVSQQQEYQAHIVQIAYIYDHQRGYLESKTNESEQNFIADNLKSVRELQNNSAGVDLIIFCKTNQLI